MWRHRVLSGRDWTAQPPAGSAHSAAGWRKWLGSDVVEDRVQIALRDKVNGDLPLNRLFCEEVGIFRPYRRYVYVGYMTTSSKLPPQVLYPLLQQQLAKLCRQGVIDAVDLFDIQLAIEICEAEMGIDRRPS